MSTLQQSLTNSMRAKLAGNEQLRNGKVLEARESYVEGLRQVLAGVEALRGEISRLSEENACENACVSLETVKCELEEVRVQLISSSQSPEPLSNACRSAPLCANPEQMGCLAWAALVDK